MNGLMSPHFRLSFIDDVSCEHFTQRPKVSDLERSRSFRRSVQCHFSVRPPEPDLRLPRSVPPDPDWRLTSSSSGLRTHNKHNHNDEHISTTQPGWIHTDKHYGDDTFLSLLLLLFFLLLGLSSEAGRQVYAWGSGGGGDG